MRVLVVDDSRMARRVVTRLLEEIGYTDVVEAADGLEALERVESEAFDLIICDWKMPGLDGRGFVEKVATTPAARVPIIMATSESDRRGVIEKLRADSLAYLQKPFRADALREKIREARSKAALGATREPASGGSSPPSGSSVR